MTTWNRSRLRVQQELAPSKLSLQIKKTWIRNISIRNVGMINLNEVFVKYMEVRKQGDQATLEFICYKEISKYCQGDILQWHQYVARKVKRRYSWPTEFWPGSMLHSGWE
jgi:hypothetical protein